jgi:hypothetical protein
MLIQAIKRKQDNINFNLSNKSQKIYDKALKQAVQLSYDSKIYKIWQRVDIVPNSCNK